MNYSESKDSSQSVVGGEQRNVVQRDMWIWFKFMQQCTRKIKSSSCEYVCFVYLSCLFVHAGVYEGAPSQEPRRLADVNIVVHVHVHSNTHVKRL